MRGKEEAHDYFENCVGIFPHPKQVSNWVMGALLGLLNTLGKSIDESPVSPENLARLLALVEEGVISGKIAKTKLLGFFVGQVMKETKGKANPKLVNEILKRQLG